MVEKDTIFLSAVAGFIAVTTFTTFRDDTAEIHFSAEPVITPDEVIEAGGTVLTSMLNNACEAEYNEETDTWVMSNQEMKTCTSTISKTSEIYDVDIGITTYPFTSP